MTTEEKAKAYDEALEKVREYYKGLAGRRTKEKLESIFPELKESEDELIRKRLINLIKELAANKEAFHIGGYFVEEQDKNYIAYLEKQKEQKPAECSEEEKARIDRIVEVLDWAEDKGRITHSDWEDYVCYVKSLKPQPAEWSEEDEMRRNHLIGFVERYGFQYYAGTDKVISWLKSLRPQPHWKPSEEQMQALVVAINESVRCDELYWRPILHGVLLGLHSDLKKLL